MLLSATSREEILTYTLFKTQTMQLSDTSEMLTYRLFKTQSMLLSATSRERLDACKLTNNLLSCKVLSASEDELK